LGFIDITWSGGSVDKTWNFNILYIFFGSFQKMYLELF